MELISRLSGDLFLLFALLIFIALVLLLEGLYLAWNAYRGPEARRIEQRLRAMSAGGAADREARLLKRRLLSEAPPLQRMLLRVPRIAELDRMLEQSGSKLSVAMLAGICALAWAGTYLVLCLFPQVPNAIAMSMAHAAATVPVFYILRKRHNRMRKLEQQLPDALDLIGRALKAGHAFPSGLQMVGEEAHDPIAREFRIVHDEINFGVSVPTALTNLATRVPSTDLRYFVIAVLIQRETGGNLTEVLENLSKLIRERLKLFGKIRVLSAEGRLSAWILSILPFALAAVINLLNPKFMAVLWTDPMGLAMIYCAGAMMFFGVLWMRKIIRIHV